MVKYNKGEWAETYVFLKCLSDGKFYVKDSTLSKLINEYEILKLYKENFLKTGEKEFVPLKINKERYIEISEKLLDRIVKSRETTFSIEELEVFSKNEDFSLSKGTSYSKNDLEGVIKDWCKRCSPRLGYSIKSKFSSSATLLNASKHTDFLYKVTGISEQQAKEINQISSSTKLKDRMKKIEEYGGKITFCRVVSNSFKNNLDYIDCGLEKILGEILLKFYMKKATAIEELIKILAEENPLKYVGSNKSDFYKNKMIKFFKEVAFKMMPSKELEEIKSEKQGGILLVDTTGKVSLLDNIYYVEELNEYLYKNLKLETPSATRYKMLELEKDSIGFRFTLNLQIRFK